MEPKIEVGTRVFFPDYKDNIQRGIVLRMPHEHEFEDSHILIEVDKTFNISQHDTYMVAPWKIFLATANGLDQLKVELVDFLERCSKPHKDATIAINNKIVSVKSMHIKHSVL